MAAALSEKELEERLKAIGEKKTAYQVVFGQADPARQAAVQLVLADLRKFCHYSSPTWSEDARHHARKEGRREVILHITDWFTLPEEELLQRVVGDSYVVVKVDPDEEEDIW